MGTSTEDLHDRLRHVWSYGCNASFQPMQRPYGGPHVTYLPR